MRQEINCGVTRDVNYSMPKLLLYYIKYLFSHFLTTLSFTLLHPAGGILSEHYFRILRCTSDPCVRYFSSAQVNQLTPT